MPGELNGLDENAIVFFESQNNTSWNLLGLDTRNTALHFVTKTGINTFARFTLSTIDNPLPVRFVLPRQLPGRKCAADLENGAGTKQQSFQD